MIRQGVLPGCEGMFSPADPMPRGTIRVAEIIDGFSRGAWGECRAFYRTIAGVKGLRKSVRWVAERIAWLQRHGILTVIHRGPKAAILRLAEHFADLLRPVLISESTSESTTPNAECSAGKEAGERGPEEKPAPGPSKPLPVGYCEQFREYIDIFRQAGKPLNSWDIQRANGVWMSLPVDQWDAAHDDAYRICTERLNPRHIPMPVWHLLDRGWTRVAQERTLPYIDPKPMQKLIDSVKAMRDFERKFGQ